MNGGAALALMVMLGVAVWHVHTGPGHGNRAGVSGPPVGFKVPAAMPDVFETLPLSDVQLSGFLGARVGANETNRLAEVDLEPLLAGFRKRPGSHPWIGEHIGKWMHAATLAWVHGGDEGIKKKLDYAAGELIKTQEADGYLGTYEPAKRFGLFEGADWDVWSHKYCLIGLLTYYQYTGSVEALEACRRMGDLLARTFGPGKKSIASAGTHMGMAATSVLEPVVLLYRFTGAKRYLDFAKYIVDSWDEPGGARVLATLTESGSVARTANAKAYEMLSNLVGLCELARATGEARYLTPALKGWDDVVRNHLYITGTASFGEHFHGEHELPNGMGAAVGETCVTVTWMQLSQQLMRLTGEAKYGEELERSLYNHLAAGQKPDGKEWCYYTALEGKKEYGPGISCCVSSGPRGMAMAPGMVYYRRSSAEGGADSLVVNLFETSRAAVTLGGVPVTVEQETGLPFRGGSELRFRMPHPARFGVLLRDPRWAPGIAAREFPRALRDSSGWLPVEAREWKDGDTVHLDLEVRARPVVGDFGNQGKVSLAWGPLVMAYDSEKNGGVPLPACAALNRVPGGELLGHAHALVTVSVSPERGGGGNASFVPFAEAGSEGGTYRVWIGAPGTGGGCSLLTEGIESRSVAGNVEGSIIDGDPSTFVVTWDGKKHPEELFGVSVDKPVTFRRVAYAHGRTFHDGGWFDASRARPRVEVQRSDGEWQDLGELIGYPATTATDPAGLKGGEVFALRLTKPVRALAVRVRGIGACGDNAAQCFASCGELGAYAD